LALKGDDVALLKLEERYHTFLTLVKLAIKSPQLREKLGLLESSG
jgi:hypothetical protein